MRAVGLFTHGGPEVLQVIEIPEVHAGPGEVRIRVNAATVNPTDVMARNGARAEQQKADPPPYVPGMEAAGIVDEVGSGVPDRLKVGDAVMAIVVPKGSHGAYREQIALDARSVVRAPTGKTHPEAASLPMNGLTARLSLDLLKLSPGQVIAVTGAAGAYGGYIIQLAKAEGLTVIADASEKDEQLGVLLPLLMIVALGIAFRNQPERPVAVDVEEGPAATDVQAALTGNDRFQVRVANLDACRLRLRLGKTDIVVIPGAASQPSYEYWFDPGRPESVLARRAVDDALQRARPGGPIPWPPATAK